MIISVRRMGAPKSRTRNLLAPECIRSMTIACWGGTYIICCQGERRSPRPSLLSPEEEDDEAAAAGGGAVEDPATAGVLFSNFGANFGGIEVVLLLNEPVDLDFGGPGGGRRLGP